MEDGKKKRNIKMRRRRSSIRRRKCRKQRPRNRGRKIIRKHASVSTVSIRYCTARTENHHSTKGDFKLEATSERK